MFYESFLGVLNKHDLETDEELGIHTGFSIIFKETLPRLDLVTQFFFCLGTDPRSHSSDTDEMLLPWHVDSWKLEGFRARDSDCCHSTRLGKTPQGNTCCIWFPNILKPTFKCLLDVPTVPGDPPVRPGKPGSWLTCAPPEARALLCPASASPIRPRSAFRPRARPSFPTDVVCLSVPSH